MEETQENRKVDVSQEASNTPAQEEEKSFNKVFNSPTTKEFEINDIEEKTFQDLKDRSDYAFINTNKIISRADISEPSAFNNFKSLIKYVYANWNKQFPNVLTIEDVTFDVESFMKDFVNFFLNDIKRKIHIRETFSERSQGKLTQESMIVINTTDGEIYLYYDIDMIFIYYGSQHIKKDSVLTDLLGVLKAYKNPVVKKNTIYVVYQTQHGFEKVPFPVKSRSSNISIQDNYNDDFQEVNKRIIEKLNNKDKTGLFIFNGEPGTGKTNYVRYLTSVIERNIIFVPPDMVNIITDPSFIPFLLNNPNCVLIIEDAESALQERGNGGRSGNISNILNMTDGLLSDCVNISIVVTFNTDFRNLDKALLRKGRLLESYEFGKLSADKAQKLMNKLGHKTKVEKPMTLSDIYFYEETNSNEKYGKKKVSGFKKDE